MVGEHVPNSARIYDEYSVENKIRTRGPGPNLTDRGDHTFVTYRARCGVNNGVRPISPNESFVNTAFVYRVSNFVDENNRLVHHVETADYYCNSSWPEPNGKG